MNEVVRAIHERRSCRSFKPDMPDRALIDEVIDAGLYAASGMGKQSPIVICVTDPELRAKLAADNAAIGGWKEGFDPFYDAPCVLIVLADSQVATHVYDGSLMLGDMMLAAHSLGLASIWIHRAREEFEMDSYKGLLAELGIKGEYVGIGHLALGYAEGELPEAAARKDGRVWHV